MIVQAEDLRARDIIQALRSGTVPSVGVKELAVGCGKIIKELREQLEYVREDRSDYKFIRGGYGAGKTFICSLFRQIALENDFCTSTVIVSPDLPLDKQNKVYTAIVKGIRTSEKKHNCAFPDVLQLWLWNLHKRIEKMSKLSYSNKTQRQKLVQIVSESIVSDLGKVGTDSGFVTAIQSYYINRANQNHTYASYALSWILGASENITTSMKSKLGLRGEISSEMGFAFLKGILKLIRDLGYAGLVIAIDEVETIMNLPSSKQRQEALETIRIIVDEVGRNTFPRCLFLITGTDKFFLDDRYGLPSYEALKDRIDIPGLNIEHQSLKQPIYLVKPLQENQLIEVAKKVRSIHASAYDWLAESRISDEDIQRYAYLMASNFGGSIEQIPRGFLRGFIYVCDLLQENENLTIEDVFGDPRYLTDQVHEVESSRVRI